MGVQPPRDYIFFLMDVVYRSDIPDDQKAIFNRVRLNMRLLTASDIVVADPPLKSYQAFSRVNIQDEALSIGQPNNNYQKKGKQSLTKLSAQLSNHNYQVHLLANGAS